MTNAGVALDTVCVVLEFHVRAETPVSTTKLPVVWNRKRSAAEAPLNIKSSCVVAPVETSAMTVFV